MGKNNGYLLLAAVVCAVGVGCATPGSGSADVPQSGDPMVAEEQPEMSQVGAAPFQRVVTGYFIQWGIYGRAYHVWDIPAEHLSHLLYAFAEVGEDHTITLLDPWADVDNPFPDSPLNDQEILSSLDFRGNFAQLVLLKHAYPHLKTLISVGGWTKSGRFSDMAATEQGRRSFAESCAAFVMKYQFDGIDIDWEYPVGGGLPENSARPEDRENYTLMMEAIRKALDGAEEKTGKEYLLTGATSADLEKIANIEFDKVHRIMDYIYVMAYDLAGGWSQQTNHQAPLFFNPDQHSRAQELDLPAQPEHYTVSAAIRGYLDAGVPPEKLVLGVPFYGRGWYTEPGLEDGMFQKVTDPLPQGTWEPGAWDYDDIKANHQRPETYRMDQKAMASYLYNPETGLVISYDSPEIMERKAEFVVDQGLGGMMFWEITQDRDLDLISIISRMMQ
ncbi:glycoside hydrolase family 18 protein [Spirochaeta lutea]|uniref:glycoside hydrolase family 18 protein n=1 Tax=Spirochaeta lutea TaxID=1480694 RepID=UPI0006910BED|nr:glycoside hydrolase family 18 protein [Spirochaeta lutea]